MITSNVKEMDSFIYKYVRFEDGVFLFVRMTSGFENHLDVSRTKPDIKPISAGMFRYDAVKKEWAMKQTGSTTLKLPTLPDDEELLVKMLGEENVELSYW